MPSPFEDFRKKRETKEAALRMEQEKQQCEQQAVKRQLEERTKTIERHCAQYDPMVAEVLGHLRNAVYPNLEVLNRGRIWIVGLVSSGEYGQEEINPTVVVTLCFDTAATPTHFLCEVGRKGNTKATERFHKIGNATLNHESLVSTLRQLLFSLQNEWEKADKEKEKERRGREKNKGFFGKLFG